MDNKEKPKILIVDDERSNILTLNYILKPAYSTFVAIDGQTAVEITKQIIPDLILLDIVMPGMTGFEVLSELKREESTRKIPVIIITGLDSMEDEETGFFLGAVDYITKPFHNSIVKARVKTHLQMVEYIREIERFGMTDTLTGIANRRSFDHRIKIEWLRALREKEPISLLMIDVDRFKEYNDAYGHTQGDVLLQAISNIFIKTAKRMVDFTARWGGEEFVVLLPNTELNGALVVAERIRFGVENSIVLCPDGTPTSVTVSVGVHTEIPVDDSTIINFISQADQAMYAAKNSGKNKVCIQ